MLRPLTIILFLLAVATAVTFSRMGKVGTSVGMPPEASVPPPTGGSGDDPAGPPPNKVARRRFAVTPASLFTFAIILGALAFLIGALDYPTRSRVFPVALSLAVICLAGMQFIMDSLKMRTGDIMDIGMRSAGMAGALRTALLVGSLLGVFLALIYLIGLKYATMVFPLGPTYLLLSGRARKIGMPVAVLFVVLFNLILMDRVMAVIWPDPLIPFFESN